MKMIYNFEEFLNEEFQDTESDLTIKEYIKKLDSGLPELDLNKIVDWWVINRSRIKIKYFPFSTNHPIMGVMLDENTIAMNSQHYLPLEIKLFITLHESYHADQCLENRFEEGYFKSVLNDDKDTFLKSYELLEKEANDKSLKAMEEMGFSNIKNISKQYRLRENENDGELVWNMMKKDIEKYKPKTFFELLKKQI
jgi:hypothetical protein